MSSESNQGSGIALAKNLTGDSGIYESLQAELRPSAHGRIISDRAQKSPCQAGQRPGVGKSLPPSQSATSAMEIIIAGGRGGAGTGDSFSFLDASCFDYRIPLD